MVAGVMGVAATQLPRWLRVAFVAALAVLASGLGLYAYRHFTAPLTLTIAVGSYDGDASRIMSAIASQLASTNSTVRLKVLDKSTVPEATKAFSAGQADLAIVRADIGDLSTARTVALLTHGVVLVVVEMWVPQYDLNAELARDSSSLVIESFKISIIQIGRRGQRRQHTFCIGNFVIDQCGNPCRLGVGVMFDQRSPICG